jgi:hypothetical protein
VIEPGDGKAYDRDPLHRQARRSLPEGLRPGRYRLLRSRTRILHLRRRALGHRASQPLLRNRRIRGSLEHRHQVRDRQPWSPSSRQGRLLPVPPVDSTGHACRDVAAAGSGGHSGRSVPPRSGWRRSERNRHASRPWSSVPDAAAEVHHLERGQHLRQDGNLHAQALRWRQRLRHARAPVRVEGWQEPVRRRRLCRPVRLRPVLHRRHHQARSCPERHHQPRHQQLQASGSRLRSAREAGLLGQEPLGLHPYSLRQQPQGAAWKPASPIL